MTPPPVLVVLIVVLAGAYVVGIRPRLLRWGTTADEVEESYPGEDLIPGGRCGASIDAERFLGLRASINLRSGRPFSTAGPRPRFYIDALWAFRLSGITPQRTRLVVSGYASARPRFLQAIADLLFWEPAHWVMQTRQFANLKKRA